MVVLTKEQVKELFSRRLNQVLDGIEEISGTKRRARRSWLRARFGVSTETARKWLMGVDLPDQANLARLAIELEVSADWLLTGFGTAKSRTAEDPLLGQLMEIWTKVTHEEQNEILRYALYRLDRPRHLPPPGAAARTSPGKRTGE